MNVRNIAVIAVKAKIHSSGQYIVALRGRCMEPLLKARDKACVMPVSGYEIGKLYLFELPDQKLAVHRLIEKNIEYAVMKGDRSKRCEKIVYDKILGGL